MGNGFLVGKLWCGSFSLPVGMRICLLTSLCCLYGIRLFVFGIQFFVYCEVRQWMFLGCCWLECKYHPLVYLLVFCFVVLHIGDVEIWKGGVVIFAKVFVQKDGVGFCLSCSFDEPTMVMWMKRIVWDKFQEQWKYGNNYRNRVSDGMFHWPIAGMVVVWVCVIGSRSLTILVLSSLPNLKIWMDSQTLSYSPCLVESLVLLLVSLMLAGLKVKLWHRTSILEGSLPGLTE